MKVRIFAVLFLLLTTCFSMAKEATLQIGDAKPIKLKQLKKEIGEEIAKVNDPYHKGWVSEFKGLSLVKLLDKKLEGWRNADAILSTSLDGYKISIPVSKIIKYNPTLTYAFKDPKKKFVFDNPSQNAKNLDYGPFYLVWDNINFPVLKRSGYYDWTWKIVKLESIQYTSYYSKAFPMLNPTPAQKAVLNTTKHIVSPATLLQVRKVELKALPC
ncbi:MAG: hypothetical protein R3A80_11270 [Bdellovibrionota bacterium]